jgi:hypothetical protein
MMRLTVQVIVLAWLLCAAGPAGSAAADKTATPTSPVPPLAVKVNDGLVSLNVHDALRGDVLRAIAGQAAIQLTIDSGASDRVTESFVDVSLDEAFRRLAKGYDVVLVYSKPGARSSRLVGVRVYQASGPRGPGSRVSVQKGPAHAVPDSQPQQQNARWENVTNLIRQARQQEPAALVSLVEILASEPDVAVRQAAAAGLATIRTPEAVFALTGALGDPEPLVRIAAVSSLGMLRDETQAPVITQVLARDRDAAVRRAAVQVLATLHSAEARRGLEMAASDSDASVRQAAKDALKQ